MLNHPPCIELTLLYLKSLNRYNKTLLLCVKMVTLIFISGPGLAISSAKQGKSGSIYNLVKNGLPMLACIS